jgi:hypothetical protein
VRRRLGIVEDVPLRPHLRDGLRDPRLAFDVDDDDRFTCALSRGQLRTDGVNGGCDRLADCHLSPIGSVPQGWVQIP